MNLKKIVSMVLFCAVLTVSVLSVGASAVERPTFGPFYVSQRYASGTILYKYTTGISTSTAINMTLDGKNYIRKIDIGSGYVKEVGTYACIYRGKATKSRFNNNFFNEPLTSTDLNKGLIVVSASANYYLTGATAIASKKSSESTKNWASVTAGSVQTSKALSSYGTMEYRNTDETLYAYFSTINY